MFCTFVFTALEILEVEYLYLVGATEIRCIVCQARVSRTTDVTEPNQHSSPEAQKVDCVALPKERTRISFMNLSGSQMHTQGGPKETILCYARDQVHDINPHSDGRLQGLLELRPHIWETNPCEFHRQSSCPFLPFAYPQDYPSSLVPRLLECPINPKRFNSAIHQN